MYSCRKERTEGIEKKGEEKREEKIKRERHERVSNRETTSSLGFPASSLKYLRYSGRDLVQPTSMYSCPTTRLIFFSLYFAVRRSGQ